MPGPTPRTVDEYMAGVPPKFQGLLERLRRTIRAAAPDAEEFISYKIPAYRQNGRLLYFAAYTDHCSVFGVSATVRRRFAAELKSFATEKGTLHFTPERPLPDDLVTRIVKALVAENLARAAK